MPPRWVGRLGDHQPCRLYEHMLLTAPSAPSRTKKSSLYILVSLLNSVRDLENVKGAGGWVGRLRLAATVSEVLTSRLLTSLLLAMLPLRRELRLRARLQRWLVNSRLCGSDSDYVCHSRSSS